MFYWQWHGPDRRGLDYDVTKFLKTHARFQDFQAHPKGGPDDPTWYWREPLFGYYLSTDPWVICKQLVMLADAGVDFLFLDYTNGSISDPELKTFLGVAEDLKSNGVAVPKLTFFLNSEPEWKIEKLYTEWYKLEKRDRKTPRMLVGYTRVSTQDQKHVLSLHKSWYKSYSGILGCFSYI